MLWILMKIFFTCRCEKVKKKGFKFGTFIGRFQMKSWQWALHSHQLQNGLWPAVLLFCSFVLFPFCMFYLARSEWPSSVTVGCQYQQLTSSARQTRSTKQFISKVNTILGFTRRNWNKVSGKKKVKEAACIVPLDRSGSHSLLPPSTTLKKRPRDKLRDESWMITGRLHQWMDEMIQKVT